jgi:hypothetical protein
VRDLQRETQKNENLDGVVNEGLRVELKYEKEIHLKLRE